jgi:hypothetical protein
MVLANPSGVIGCEACAHHILCYFAQALPHFKTTFARWSRLSLGSLLVGCVLLLNALAASPTLHEWVHTDAGQTEHQCAVTLFAHGQMDASVAVAAAAVPSSPADFFPQPSVSVSSTIVETLPPGRGPPVSLLHS